MFFRLRNMTSSYIFSKNNKKTKANISRDNQLYSSKNIFSFQPQKNKKFDSSKLLPHSLIKKSLKKIIIEWEEGEKQLYLTGSLDHINKLFFSKIDSKEYFYSKLDYNFSYKKLKFKSKGNLKINSIYLISNKTESFKKEENIFLRKPKKKLTESTNDSSFESFLKDKQSKKNVINNLGFAKINYCNYIPKQSEMNEKFCKIPAFFPTECFNGINYFHYEIGDKKFLNLKEMNIHNNNNNSYKIIDKKDHLLLNHFCQKNINKNIISCLTIRYRHKNTTFLYYK